MLHLGLLLAVVSAVSSEDLIVGDKWATFIPKGEVRESKTWTLSADSGSTVKIFCPDARFPGGQTQEELCRWSKMVFDDGISKRSFCGTQYNFQVIGRTSKMSLELILPQGSAGHLECQAKAVHPPKSYEEVIVKPKDGIKRISYPEVRGEENDKAWRFTSGSKFKISLQCDVRAERPQNGVCIKDIVTVDNGEGPKQQCGYDGLVAVSSGKEITLRFETYPTTESRIVCKVETMSGPNEYDNDAATIEDSSEHGVIPGKKNTTCECGKANRKAERIINGTEVTHESKYPFMVSLRSPGNGHFCGASILSPVHILTAAHCVSDSKTRPQPNPADVIPTVGAHSSEDSSHGETQKLKVKKISIPKEWFSGSLFAGDVAVLHLETPIRFSKWVSPVCLTPDEPDIISKYIRHMGWGLTEDGYPDKLREANVLVLHQGMCNNNPQEVCFKNGPSTQCFGDSGGPFVFVDPETNRYTQVGLASYVYGMCSGSYFIATNTVYWYDWIKDAMAETSASHGICRKID